jgi:putative CRISPR-associated protein (TIGR02619 family)
MLSIISTVGTSVFGKPGTTLNNAVREFTKQNSVGIEAAILTKSSFPGFELYQQALADLKAKTTSEFLRDSCAELNAIEGIHADHHSNNNHEYHFLASQTPSGALAARVLADFCREKYQATKAQAYRVEGLQVEDGRDFRVKGLPSLIQRVYELLNDAKRSQLTVVLNPTGGFKAAIPYLTLVGMLRQAEGVTVSCIHESSKNLITLAGLPISLNLSSIKHFLPLLQECYAAQVTGLDVQILRKELTLNSDKTVEEHPLWSLFEKYDDNHYMLSGLGSIVLKELSERTKKQPVCLSKQAAEAFDRLKQGGARDKYIEIFDHIGDADMNWLKLFQRKPQQVQKITTTFHFKEKLSFSF